MNGPLLANALLLVVAGFAGTALGLIGFALVRFLARDAFGQDLVRDHVARGGPFRGGNLERLVAKDAPLTLRLAGILGLGATVGDAFMHLALGCVEWSIVVSRLPRIHREEVGPAADGSMSAALGWALAHRSDLVGFIVSAALVVAIAVGADLALARVVVQLLRHQSVGLRALKAVVVAVIIARALDLWVALHPPSPLSAIPGLDDIPGFVPAFTLPVLALTTWLVVRMAQASPARTG